MAFSATQLRALRRDVDRRNLRTRQVQNGRELTYIEGWHAIAEANRIFGFDGWDRETMESRCVLAREIRGAFTAIYIARVRIKVRADGETVIREGHGTGESQGSNPGEIHDKAVKAAETDATKRALATFGKPFGLGLYLSRRPTRRRALPPKVNPAQPDSGSAVQPAALSAEPAIRSGSPRDLVRRRTLQRLGPNGRYHVPPRTEPTSDSFHAILANELTGKAVEPIEADKNLDDRAGTSRKDEPADATTDAPPIAGAIRASLTADTAFLIAHPRRIRDKDHLIFVATQPCLLCGRTPSDAHHLRYVQPRAMSRKVSDEFTVPLCRTHHRQLHQSGDEASWWNDLSVDPLPIAQELWQQSRGHDERTIETSVETAPAARPNIDLKSSSKPDDITSPIGARPASLTTETLLPAQGKTAPSV
ncbi:MAG: hypothetical protein K8F62_07265 [Pseudorhodoplanes sp.]|nr:hypothetical protein [Pseudorhodoplanes sp.]